MSRQNQKLIVILGPTASGKSELAVKLAKKFRGEIISADSRQVYKHLNIGSGKVTKKEMQGIKHYLLDVASPKKVFTVQDFKKHSQKAIEDISNKGKIPIICGGTGFYIDAITSTLKIPEVGPDWQLRKKLEKKSSQELFEMLKKLDSRRAKNIDPKNRRRLIRAIEIVKTTKKPIPLLYKTTSKGILFLGLAHRATAEGLVHSQKAPKERIDKRINQMLKKGLVGEVKKLRKLGLGWKRIYELGFEYKYPAFYLQKKIGREEMIESLKTQNWRYAKRQITWFKKNKNIKWIKTQKQAEKLIKEFL